MMRFKDRLVVVTGAATGIGASAARLFEEEGAEVVAVQNRTPAPYGSRRITMDLADPESIEAAAAQVPDRVDFLCNIAAMGADDNSPEDIIGANFLGTRRFTELVFNRVAKHGSILNTASVAARYWRQNVELVLKVMAMTDRAELVPFWRSLRREHQFSYTLSKAAIVVWSMKLANAHAATGPRVNVVSPGFTDTPMLQRAFANANQAVKKLAESNNSIASPDDVARIYLLLCSDEARVINGTEILADAGLMSTVNIKDYGL